MEIRKRKQVKAPARPGQQPQPINSAFAAEVRRRAEVFTEPVEKQDKIWTSAHSRQRQKAEQQMAILRSEAVQARRLAEHIENLSQQAAAYKHKRKHAMTDSTIVDPGHTQRRQRRAQDKPATGSNQRNFNPLHPSMELPPEQLIRLLGMESKKIRKSRKPRPPTPKQTPPAAEPAVAGQHENSAPESARRPTPGTSRTADRSIQYEHCDVPQVFDSGRSGLLVPALLTGVVAGIVVSGYLFWFQPGDTSTQKTPAPVATSQPKKLQPNSKLVERKPAPVARERKMSAQERVVWQTRVEAREQSLRSAAEQRLSERVSQLQQTPPATQTYAAPVREVPPLPVTASTPATIAPEAVSDTVTPADAPASVPMQSPVQPAPGVDPDIPAPAPAAIEVLEETESPVEATQPVTDAAPATPLEPAADLAAPVEAIPGAATANELRGSEPAPAAPEVTEPGSVNETAPAEETSALPGTPAENWSAVNAGDVLF